MKGKTEFPKTPKFPKTHITSFSYNNMSKTAMTEIQSLLGFRDQVFLI
jgi:hypothetical protein